MPPPSSPIPSSQQWRFVSRWQEFEGEGRVNLLRAVSVLGFYAVQLIHYVRFSDRSPEEQLFHRLSTLIAVAWLFLSLAVLISLQRRFLPAALKFGTTFVDLLLITALAWLGSGPSSPITLAYFLVIASAGLRFSLPLVWMATLSAMGLSLVLVGLKDKVWFDEAHEVPVVNQLVTLLSLGMTGIVIGQIVRRVRTMAEDFAARLGRKGGDA